MVLAESVYRATGDFPTEEKYGLVAQLRRCAVSIPSNIAEGNGRLTTRDWQHFLAQARGSVLELETQLILAQRLGFGDSKEVDACLHEAEEIGRIINGLLSSTRSRATRKDFDDPDH